VGGFELFRLTQGDIPALAKFLKRRTAAEDASTMSGVMLPVGDLDGVETNLRWRFALHPAAASRLGIGHALRDADGSIGGALLAFPARFRIEERKLLGLCGCGFFVEPKYRSQGFFLFRRFLAERGVDFWFATTCNRVSGAIWGKLGARAMDYSGREYLMPLRVGPILEEVVRRVISGPVASIAGRALGRIATPFLRPRLALSDLEFRACRDWDFLAHLAARHRDPALLTAERSSAELEWRYGQTPARAAIEVLHFRDRRGREGWVSVGDSRRGRAAQIRNCMVLDIVMPRDGFDLGELLCAIVRHLSDRTDLITFRGPNRVGTAAVAIGARVRRFPSPMIYLRESFAGAGQLVDRTEFFPADGDMAN
jgi:hypothetical protein